MLSRMLHGNRPLVGRRIAVLAVDGFELVELVVPANAMRLAGATVDVISIHRGHIRGMNLHEPASRVRVNLTLDQADPNDYDGLLIPGGFVNPDLLVVRGDNLYKDMSAYLAQRVEDTPNIEVLFNTEVARISGGESVGEVELANRKTGERRVIQTSALFSFIGAVPRSDWLPPDIERDAKHFVRTGAELAQSGYWKSPRLPFMLETSHPGVFAAGDVRSGSVKRVASAVGEGAMAVQFVHQYLSQVPAT